MRTLWVAPAAAYGAAVLVAAMGTSAWPGVRSVYTDWAADRYGYAGWAAVLDEHAARLAAQAGADRHRLTLILLVHWRHRLDARSVWKGLDPLWTPNDDAADLLPDPAREWAEAHKASDIASEELIDALRWQLTNDPGADEADPAGAMLELVRLLGWAGREEERAAVEREALSLHRQLALTDLLAFGPGLGALLEDRARRADGAARIDPLTEATALYRRLADLDAARFGAALVDTSRALATRLVFARRRDEAAAAARDHVDACRLPGVPGRELVSACGRAATILWDVDQRPESLRFQEEAVAVQRVLADAAPADADNSGRLADALETLAGRLADAGRAEDARAARDEALAAREVAITVFRRVAGEDEPRYGRWLARATARQADRLAEVRGYADALALAHETVAIDRRLAAADPRHGNSLARTLNVIGNLLAKLGRHAEAVTAKEESVAIHRRRADADPEASHGHLAISLANLAMDLKRVGRDDEALATEQEAVDILRPLARRRSRKWGPALGTALNNVACSMSARGRHDEALAASGEAVATHRLLVGAQVPKFAISLWTFAEVRAAAGLDLDAALDAAEEAVALYERLAGELPATHSASLRGARGTVADVLAARAL